MLQSGVSETVTACETPLAVAVTTTEDSRLSERYEQESFIILLTG
jgi:hypothetical protein